MKRAKNSAATGFAQRKDAPPIDLQELANRGGGDFYGHYVRLPGPGHSARDDSLSVSIGRNGRVILHSFAGDDDAKVRAYLKSLGVDVSGARATLPGARRFAAAVDIEAKRKAAAANRIWGESVPIAGTLASRYLESRAIASPWPLSLRFHSRCPDGKQRRPALIAACTSLDAPMQVEAIQRIFLCPLSGRKAAVQAPKKALGAHRGRGVVLGAVTDTLLVSEGIESGLSASAQFNNMPAIATLGAEFMSRLIIPTRVRHVVIAADEDEPGLRAAFSLAARLRGEGRIVCIRTPPTGFKDFNDLAMHRASPA
jgi:hypothetical protein